MRPPHWVIVSVVIIAGACNAGDNTVDPSDLALRDLLGVSPEVASSWNAVQRAAARRVLVAGFREADPPAQVAFARTAAGAGAALDDQVASSLATGDARRAADGAGPLGAVRVQADPGDLAISARIAPATATALGDRAPPRTGAAVQPVQPVQPVELWLSDRWDAEPRWGHLPGRGREVLSALAVDADHGGGPIIVVPAPRLAVIAAYIKPHDDATPPHLAVNPVLLAALEPDADELATAAALQRWSTSEGADPPRATVPPPRAAPTRAATGGNPYSFYGSFEECALAQRRRCAACLPGNTCTPITDTADGNAECTMLDANAGRGYFLLCINLSLAITSVARCTGDAAPTCPRDTGAADRLATLDNNAGFLDDPACAGALDGCLAKIYGAPQEPFPGLDGGPEPTEPPRSTSVSCGHACDHDNANCDASPSFDCSGPSCNNSLSCDSACSSSNHQSGCGGNCNSCTSSGGGGGGGGGCGGGSSSSGGSCGSTSGGSSSSGCGGGSSSSSCGGGSGGSCGGSGGSCGGSGGSCGGSGGSCGGSGGSCGGSGGSCGGGGGGKCSAASSDPGPGVALAMSVIWGLLPVPFAAFTRRRARRRRRDPRTASPAPSAPPAHDGESRESPPAGTEAP